jgi:hypothetical protein
MRLLKRFAQLSGVEKRSLIRVWFVVGAARAALCVLPAGASRRVAARAATGVTGSVEQLVWAVEIASRYLPGATCLTQALAAQAYRSAGTPGDCRRVPESGATATASRENAGCESAPQG